MNKCLQKLRSIIKAKQSRLALSADVTDSQTLLKLADSIGPYICVLKTHIDIIEDFTPVLTKQLRALADKHNFLIFEDRKFADIGNTVKLQFTKGIYHIAQWADIINAHGVTGPGVIEGLQAGADLNKHALLLLAELSSKGSLAVGEYRDQVIEMANKYPEFVIGFIGQRRLTSNPDHIVMTPGVSLAASSDKLGQQYTTPREAIERGADIIIVGRGIIGAQNPANEAQKYQLEAWNASKQT